MSAYLEVWRREGLHLCPLDADRVTLGRASSNDFAFTPDKRVSQLHAVLERYEAGWSVRDLGSRNGTFVNGERIWGEYRLRPGDAITIGETRLVYRERSSESRTETEAGPEAPRLTRRERDVLLELCRPVLTAEIFTEPASVREIAQALVLTDSAVKQHLIRLSDKFGVHERGERRRARLANEALARGAVTLADLRTPQKGGEPTPE